MDKIQVRPKVYLIISIIAAVIFALMIPAVNVNSDMTKYLPDNSKMKRGMDILSSEFGQSASSAVADIRIMMCSDDEAGMQAVADSISRIAGVDAVSVTKGKGHTLFELNVSKSVNQKRLAKNIKASFPYESVTQTSQDGNTPDPKALLLAVACLIVILILMSKSYLEPLLFLISTGMAVAVNMGTNALLNSVSITTHSIVAVLQLALSMDYSIILMSRFRQQMEKTDNKYEAMDAAIRNASPAILSSSLTTVVGLLMLVFMNLKIGLDLGVVLAKGVICSLLYTYAALPGLILLCYKGIKASEKRARLPHTDGLADFCRKFRIPLTIAFVLIFVLSYHFSKQTPIKFSTSTPSEIDKVFPKKNTVVLLYDNDKEDSILPLLEKAEQDTHVESVYSYPTLLKKELSAEDMVAFLQEQAEQRGAEGAEMLTPEIMRIIYYAKFGDQNLKLGFTELVDFVTSLGDNPLLQGVDIPDLGEKLEMLDAIRQMSEASSIIVSAEPQEERVHGPQTDERMTVHEYMVLLEEQLGHDATADLLNLSDPDKVNEKMTVDEMSAFIRSTPTQTRMVYSFSKNTKEGMTPVEFAHFLVDDLFNRKALSKMVSKDQKDGMTIRMRIMDAAASGALLSKDAIDEMVREYGITRVLHLESSPVPVTEEEEDIQIPAIEPVTASAADSTAVIPVESAVTEPEEDPRVTLLTKMLKPGRKYDAVHMARNFRALGENVDETAVSLLYTLYGSEKFYNPEWKMDLEGFVNFAEEMLDKVQDQIRQAGLDMSSVDPDMVKSMKSQLQEGAAALRGPQHSIAAIITDYPDETPETEAFVRSLEGDHYLIGESVMLCEMKDGFADELRLITLLTIAAIFAIVLFTFRSILTSAALVMTVMSSVFINVAACGIGGGSDLYLAYLIVQSILMGATIDYGILFTTYYRENLDLREAYRGSIHTILTSGLIISCVPGAMAILLDDAMIQPIVQNLAVGSFSAIIIILFILPGVISLVCRKKK